MSVICLDHYELANVLVCADCDDEDNVDKMIDYSALNTACYRHQDREERHARSSATLKDRRLWRAARTAASINHSSLERAIDNCNPDAEQAYNTVRILHDNLITTGGIRFSKFDLHHNDCMRDWIESLKIRILERIAASPPLTATTTHRPCFQRPMA